MRLLKFTRKRISVMLKAIPIYLWVGLALTLTSAGIIIGIVALLPPSSRQATATTSQVSQEVETTMELLQSHWDNLPGSTRGADGLRIRPEPFVIVNQDGSGGQSNPPVNLYGAHLQVNGDLIIHAALREVHGKATFSLYGDVPIIYDEFRYEQNTLQLTFDGNQLRLQAWQNGHPQPKINRTFPITSSDAQNLTILRQDGLLFFTVNGTRLGSIPEYGLFASGAIWFGAGAEGHEWRLASLKAEKKHSDPLQVVDTSSLRVSPLDQQGLQHLASKQRAGFITGAAMALAPLVSDTEYARTALGGNFGSLTTENALKWQFIHPAPGSYDFHEADALIRLAHRHNLKVHGHTLVFGEANPRWVQTLPTATDADKRHAEQVMRSHIATVMEHYVGRIASWDVVNEPLADYDDFEQGKRELRNHIWYRAMGEDYIAKAFRTAHDADPYAKLFINEYGLEEDGERWEAFLRLVTRLKQQGVPLDGVGFQAHVYDRGDRISNKVLRRHIQQLAALGLKSRISEMDVYIEDGQAVQAQQYSTVLRACLQEPSCVSFTTWGVSDRYNMFRDDDGSLQYGQDFLWDDHMRPTPAVETIKSLLQQNPQLPLSN